MEKTHDQACEDRPERFAGHSVQSAGAEPGQRPPRKGGRLDRRACRRHRPAPETEPGITGLDADGEDDPGMLKEMIECYEEIVNLDSTTPEIPKLKEAIESLKQKIGQK